MPRQIAPDDNSFGRLLAAMRQAKRVSRKHLAQAVGVQPRRIRDVENGRLVPLGNARIAKAAQRLGVPVAPLLLAAEASRSCVILLDLPTSAPDATTPPPHDK